MLNTPAVEEPTALRRADGHVAFLLAAVGLFALSWMALAVRPGYLSFSDCVPYLIQAHIFQHGHLTRPAPVGDAMFSFGTIGMVQHKGREFSRQPPGASALFALLTRITGEVRLAPAILSAAAIGLNFLWIRRIYNRRTAVLAGVLCLLSAMYLQIGASAISYAPSGLLLAAAMWAFTVSACRPHPAWAGLTGLFIGLQFATRPYTAILVAAALLITRIVVFRDRPGFFRQAVAFIVGLVPGITLLLVHNRLVTDHFLPLAFTLHDPNDRIGFGLRGLGHVSVNHTPTRAVVNLAATLRTTAVNAFVFWVGLVPLAIWWLGRAIRGRRSTTGAITRWDVALAVIASTLICGHMLYWYPRAVNYFEALPLLLVLVARGYGYMADSGRALRWLGRVSIALFAIGGALITKLMLVDASILPVKAIHSEIARARRDDKAVLVFVRTVNGVLGEDLAGIPERSRVFLGLMNYSLSPEQPLLYAVDRGPANSALVARYPEHRPYLLLTPPAADPNRKWPFEPVLVPLTPGYYTP